MPLIIQYLIRNFDAGPSYTEPGTTIA